MVRQLRTAIVKNNNLIRDRLKKIDRHNNQSDAYFSNQFGYIKNRYDVMQNKWSKYLLDNYQRIYLEERWKHIIKSKRINKRLIGVPFQKEVNTNRVNDFIKGVLRDMDNAVDNGKKERYLQLRLIRQRNRSVQAFLVEDEIETILQDAESYPEARKELIAQLNDYSDDGQTVVVETYSGKTLHYDIKYYADMVMRTAIREVQTQATLAAAEEVGTSLVEVSVHNTVCPICIEYEGKIYSIDGKNPLFPPLENSPPFHPNPYDKETKILTKNRDWIYVKNAKIGDICLSLNKDTNEIEYAKVTRLYKFKKEKMIKFESSHVDMLVSKEHKMLVSDKNENKLVNAETLLTIRDGYFLTNSMCGQFGLDNHVYYLPVADTKRGIVDYNDYAYCVELDKNHVLYASRNGKCMWSGNCLHSLTVTFESVLVQRGLQQYIDFSQGRLDVHPTARGWIPIAERKIV